MDFDFDRPIFIQIKEMLYHKIAGGGLLPGQKVPSVRELALEFRVNPNTVQRAYRDLESENILFTRRGQGTYVTEDRNKVSELRSNIAEESAVAFINTIKSVGFTAEDAFIILKNITGKENL